MTFNDVIYQCSTNERMTYFKILCYFGTSLATQWLRLHDSNAGGTGSTPGQGSSHMLWDAAKNKKKKSYFCHVDIAGIPLPQNLSGYSLLPSASEMFKNEQKLNLHPPWILSEFHGCNVNASTYMLRTNQWKYIAYSDGASVLPQLFGKFADIIF